MTQITTTYIDHIGRNKRSLKMKTLLTTTAMILAMSTAAMADHDKGNGKSQDDKGEQGEQGPQGQQGVAGNDGQDGARGLTGATGNSGADGSDGVDAVAPLGSLSFAAASATFYGDGVGFGLSNSNYGDLEGSVVFGFDIDNDWRVVSGITTDFKGKTAGSIGVGVSF